MASLIPGYEYDIFISYRQKDNKYDSWVTTFVDNLKKELEATFKEDISIYFDENPHDGLLETHNVDKSLEIKLKCLVFIPVISQTYCDPKSFAWQKEFCTFNMMSKKDKYGRDIRIPGGNVASRILPVKINELDPEDKILLEKELGGAMRAVEFIYREPGVNRPLTPEDEDKKNLNRTKYRNQINKVANAVKEIFKGIRDPEAGFKTERTKAAETKKGKSKVSWIKIALPVSIIAILIAGTLMLPSNIKKLSLRSSVAGKSIAVLPFDNLSNDPDQDYFSAGIVDEILDKLFKIGDLKVIARTSSERFKNTNLSLKEIARELGVATIMEGSVRKAGNNVRITIQLIDARSESHIWSEIYDKDITDIFLIQSDVAQSVAKALRTVINPGVKELIEKRPTENMSAYDAYLMGIFHYRSLNRDGLETALYYFELARARDPGFALAYAGIGRVWRAREQMGIIRSSEATPIAEAAIMKALEMDSNYSEVHHALGGLRTWSKWDWKGGEESFRKALQLNPKNADAHSSFSHLLNILGKPDEAMEHIAIALDLDPMNSKILSFYGMDLMFTRRYNDAVKAFQKALELNPAQGVADNIIPALFLAGREEEAKEMQKQHWRNNKEYLRVLDEGYSEAGFRGGCKRLAVLRAEKFKITYSSPWAIAILYSMADDTSNALLWLENAYEEHNPNIPYLLSPIFDKLRDDPRFREIAGKMNLPLKY